MGDPILWPVWIRGESRRDMLAIVGQIATPATLRTAIIDMNMSSQLLTNEIAHHWRAVVVGRETPPIQLESNPIGTIDSPTS